MCADLHFHERVIAVLLITKRSIVFNYCTAQLFQPTALTSLPTEPLTNSLKKTSLVRRLQTQTLLGATPLIGKLHQFSKMAITFEEMMELYDPSDLESSKPL